MMSLFAVFGRSGTVLITLAFVAACIVATVLLTARNDEKR
jgi:hypothetical protein